MKIAVISTTTMIVPLAGYGGLEQLAWQQAEGLKAKGHDVLLIAPKGSKTSAALHETTEKEQEGNAFAGYKERVKDYDVIIDNSWNKFSYLLQLEGKKTPIIGVCHSTIESSYGKPPPVEKPCFVGISQDQTNRISKHLRIDARTCYNGIDLDFYKPVKLKRNDRYLFLARMSGIKGPDKALWCAVQSGKCLDLVGDDVLTAEPDLVNQLYEDCSLNASLRYVGPQSRPQCVEWFNKNKAMIHTTFSWPEPFGLALVEAQACGMPVIAPRSGGCQETVIHGETGFLVSSPEEMVDLMKEDATSQIPAEACRENASRFTIGKMVDRYESLCQEALDTGGW